LHQVGTSSLLVCIHYLTNPLLVSHVKLHYMFYNTNASTE